METGVWWPITRSRKERWLDLTLVLDNSPSMALWRRRVTAFAALLEQLGAFRGITIRLLDFEDGEPVLRGGTPGAPPRDPGEILDSSGRRAVLLVTDGVGDAWRHGELHPMVCRWASTMPVSVVHLLPQWLWGRSGFELHKARLSVPGALKPNNRWTFDLPDAWLAPDPSVLAPPGTVPVPVIELQPRWLSWWARLITGEQHGPVEGTVLLATDHARAGRTGGTPGPLSAEVRVHQFRSMASPPALRLATLLAAVPVHLDVAQLVRQRFVPEAREEHLSELLVSGILYAPGPRGGKSTRDTSGPFSFPEAVRELLLSGARRSETEIGRAHV